MPVHVREISLDRLKQWLSECVEANATPIALIAVGHDAHSGELHVFHTLNGPSDEDLGAIIGDAAIQLMQSGGKRH